jgi:alpha-beta hydrolase superfamily lysophospholipase
LITEEATFKCGGELLFRRAVRPAQGAWARLALCHGYGEHSGRHAHALQWLAERGVECHALDLRGQGRSSGQRGYVHRWDHYVDDFLGLLQEVGVSPASEPRLPTFALGHSHGALVVIAALLRGLEGVDGAVLTAPYLRSCMEVPQWKQLLARLLNPVAPRFALHSGLRDDWMCRDEAMIRDSREDALNVRQATVRWYVSAHQTQSQLRERAGELHLPLLVMTGAADPISEPEAVREFVERAGSPDKTFHLYPELLHEIFRERCREELFETVLQWLRAHATRSPSGHAHRPD